VALVAALATRPNDCGDTPPREEPGFGWAFLLSDNDLNRAIRRIADPVTRNQVETLIKEAYRALFLMMLAKSPVILLLLVAALPGLIALRYFRIGVNAVKAIEPRARGFIQLEADAA
jgi:hypothetical protein